MSEAIELNSVKRRNTPQQVFVYGTLKKGYGNHKHFMQSGKFLGQGVVDGILFHIGGFPALSLYEKFSQVRGEVYQFENWDDILRLDRLEGVPHHYHRIQTPVYPYGTCWTYIYPYERASKQMQVIPAGEWLGQETPSAEWLGWNKGVTVGSIATEEDKIVYIGGEGTGRWVLKKNHTDDNYVLIDTKDNKVLGNYSYLGEILGTDGKLRHRLQLPRKGIEPRTVRDLVKESVMRQAATNPEIQGPLCSGAEVRPACDFPVAEPIPQAASVLGIKVVEA